MTLEEISCGIQDDTGGDELRNTKEDTGGDEGYIHWRRRVAEHKMLGMQQEYSGTAVRMHEDACARTFKNRMQSRKAGAGVECISEANKASEADITASKREESHFKLT
eukprot:1142902-Pelagomonas_calceolata.AAC.2